MFDLPETEGPSTVTITAEVVRGEVEAQIVESEEAGAL